MSRYTEWQKRCQNATPYAHEAVCTRCINDSQVKATGFCCRTGRWTKLPAKEVYESKPGFCPEYIPKQQKDERDAQRDYEAAVEMAEYCERYEPTYNAEDGSM